MRIVEAVREGLRDVRSGAARAGTMALLVVLLLGAVVGLRASTAVEDVRAAYRWVASGAATTIVTAEGRIDGQACDALVDLPSVVAAGAIRQDPDGTTPAVLPRSAVPTFATSRGFAAVVGVPVVGTAGVALSQVVADELGLRAGETFRTPTGSTRVAGVFASPDDGRDTALEYALLAPVLDDGTPFDACWATIWPEDDTAQSAARRTVLPATGAEGEERVTTGTLNATLGTRFAAGAPPDADRATAVLAGALGLVLGVVAVLRRRLAVASDRHVGVAPVAQVVEHVVQHLVWGTVGAAAVLAVVVVLVRGLDPPDALPVVTEALATTAVGVAGVVLGAPLGLALVRERALHRYFRSR